MSCIHRILILSYYLDGCLVQLVGASPTVSKNLWECIAPALHIAINSDVNGLVFIYNGWHLHRMVGEEENFGIQRRIMADQKRKMGSASKKNMAPLADYGALKYSSGAVMMC